MKHLLLSCCLFLFAKLFAQEPEAALRKFADSFPQEKVVLLFSKQAYVAGETAYFKAYALVGYEPSLLSTNLSTELYDKNGRLLQKQLLPLIGGSGSGGFSLPVSLAEDVYYVRAYTQWMRNFDERFQYLQPLPVYNAGSQQRLQTKPVEWQAQAFIESGRLIAGLPANIAVRLFSAASWPTHWSGQVLEEGNSTPVAELNVYNTEIGQVRFLPQEGKKYRIMIKDAAGKTEALPLPDVQKTGILLQAGIAAGQLRYNIQFKDVPAGGNGYKMLVAYNNDVVVAGTITRSAGAVAGSFDLNDLSPGVVQFALFNEQNELVIERLFFLKQDAVASGRFSVAVDTLSFGANGYNHWTVAGDSIRPETVAALVADAPLWQPPAFISAVYLTADLAGPIYGGDWYFTDVTTEKKAALDALLLTERWTRFSWSQLLKNQFPLIRYKPDTYLRFTGTVFKGKKPQPLRDVNLILRAADSSFSFLQVTTDSNGSFYLDNLVFADSLSVYYQPNKRKLLENDIEISFEPENRFSPYTGPWPASHLTTGPRGKEDTLPVFVQRETAQQQQERLQAEKVKVMEEVVVKAKARNVTEELEKRLTSGLFSGGQADVFDFVNDNQNNIAGSTNVLQWLQGRVPGLSVFNRNGTYVAQIRNGPVQLFLNEMLADPDMINSLSLFDVALVKIYRGNFVGSLGAGSAIAVYTRRGGMSAASGGPSLPSARLKGYDRITMPLYPPIPKTNGADLRTILFYNTLMQPGVEADKISVRFYNNDISGGFRILVTGFTPDGRLVYVNRLLQDR